MTQNTTNSVSFFYVKASLNKYIDILLLIILSANVCNFLYSQPNQDIHSKFYESYKYKFRDLYQNNPNVKHHHLTKKISKEEIIAKIKESENFIENYYNDLQNLLTQNPNDIEIRKILLDYSKKKNNKLEIQRHKSLLEKQKDNQFTFVKLIYYLVIALIMFASVIQIIKLICDIKKITQNK